MVPAARDEVRVGGGDAVRGVLDRFMCRWPLLSDVVSEDSAVASSAPPVEKLPLAAMLNGRARLLLPVSADASELGR